MPFEFRRAPGVRRILPRAALLVLVLAACKSDKETTLAPADLSAFGRMAPDEDVDFAPYLAAARAVVTHATPPPAPTAVLPAQRIVLTLWSPPADPVVATAMGKDLYASVLEAGAALAKDAPSSFRLQLDVVKSAEPVTLEDAARESVAGLGNGGFAAVADGRVGVVTPSEMLARTLFDPASLKDRSFALDVARTRGLLASRSGIALDALPRAKTFRFTTTSRIESSPPAGALPVSRLLLPRREKLDEAALLGAVRAGADYLCRVIDDTGKYEYMYHPLSEKPDSSYGMLRHAGSTFALLEAWSELGTPLYRTKAEAALAFLKNRTYPSPDGSFVTDSKDEEQQKAGGSGLALIAWAKHAELTGDRSNLEAMQKLGFFIVHQQYPDGHFRDNADVDREATNPNQKKHKAELPYYPGEAILGLVRLYQLDPRDMWLRAAKNGARFLIESRDANLDEDHLTPDHWLTYALFDLYRLTKDEAYLAHMFKIGRAIVKRENDPSRRLAPDFAGTFFDTGDTTGTSTRLEALATDIEASRYTGKDTAWLDANAMTLATFMAGQQYDAQNAFFLRHPDKALGGVREGLFVSDIRIDYVQHAMSAWLRLARLIRNPSYGTPGTTGIVDAGAPDARR